MFRNILLICCFFYVFCVQAQTTRSHILLFDMAIVNDSMYQFSGAKFLTAFNLNGYNNQPYFVNSNELLFTAKLAKAEQTDLYHLHLGNRTITQLTQTTASEYSPIRMPDGKSTSAVVVENDGQATQRLWKFPVRGQGKAEALIKELTGVGYHCWLDDRRVALYLLPTTQHELSIYDLGTRKTQKVALNPGRTLQWASGSNLIYVQKATEKTWYIKSYDPKTGKQLILMPTLPGKEDFVMMSDGTFLMGSGTMLYKYKAGKDKQWRMVGDFSKFGFRQISRLALSPDGKLAMVME